MLQSLGHHAVGPSKALITLPARLSSSRSKLGRACWIRAEAAAAPGGGGSSGAAAAPSSSAALVNAATATAAALQLTQHHVGGHGHAAAAAVAAVAAVAAASSPAADDGTTSTAAAAAPDAAPVPAGVLAGYERQLGADVSSVALTLAVVTGVIAFWRGVWSLLDHLVGESLLGDVCCVIAGLTLVMCIRLSGAKVATSIWPPG
jgi:hypothetical protein